MANTSMPPGWKKASATRLLRQGMTIASRNAAVADEVTVSWSNRLVMFACTPILVLPAILKSWEISRSVWFSIGVRPRSPRPLK